MRALVKLEQVLPSHLRRRVQALQAATQTLQVYGGPQVDPQYLTILAAAVRDHERVRFAYTARDRAGTQREVEPHSLVNAGPPLVPRRLRLRPRRLAHVPRRPDREARLHRRALPPARAAGQGRRRVRLAVAAVLSLALRGAGHGRVPGGRAAGPALARRRRHADRRRTAASCARPTTTSTGWRCGSRCSPRPTRSTSRRS